MKLCSLDDENMVIKYIAPKEDAVISDKDVGISAQEDKITSAVKAKNPNVCEDNIPTVLRFVPDTSKPFVLKNAVIEIMSNDAPEINKFRKNNGFSVENLCTLIEKYYEKSPNLSSCSDF